MSIGEDHHALTGERGDGDPQQPSATAGQGAPPDVRNREQERGGDRTVRDPEGDRGWRELFSADHGPTA